MTRVAAPFSFIRKEMTVSNTETPPSTEPQAQTEESITESQPRRRDMTNVTQGQWAMHQLEANLHDPRRWVEDDRI